MKSIIDFSCIVKYELFPTVKAIKFYSNANSIL